MRKWEDEGINIVTDDEGSRSSVSDNELVPDVCTDGTMRTVSIALYLVPLDRCRLKLLWTWRSYMSSWSNLNWSDPEQSRADNYGILYERG